MFISSEDKKYGIMVISIIILDQITKLIIRLSFTIGETKFWLFTYIQNTGAAFGILKDTISLLSWISIIAVGLLLYLYATTETRFKLPLVLILAGTIGNGIDRFLLNYVVDFIDFKIWPAFNIADSVITIGGILLAWQLLKK